MAVSNVVAKFLKLLAENPGVPVYATVTGDVVSDPRPEYASEEIFPGTFAGCSLSDICISPEYGNVIAKDEELDNQNDNRYFKAIVLSIAPFSIDI